MNEKPRSNVFCCFKTKMHVTDVPKGKYVSTNSAPNQLSNSNTREVKSVVLPNSEPIKETSIPITVEPKATVITQEEIIETTIKPISKEIQTVTPSTKQLNGTVDIEVVTVEESAPSSTSQDSADETAPVKAGETVEFTVMVSEQNMNGKVVVEEAEIVNVEESESSSLSDDAADDTKPVVVEDTTKTTVMISEQNINGTVDIEETKVNETSAIEEHKSNSEIIELETISTEEASASELTESTVTVSTKEVIVTTETISDSSAITHGENHEATTGYTGDGTELITVDLFTDILEKQFGKHTIKFFNAKNSGGGGENYMSWMFYVTIDIEKEDGTEAYSSYIVKLMPPNDPQADFKKAISAFPKEVEMYEHMIPEMEKLLSENGINIQLAPKCWKTLSEPYELLIFEDLKAHKYENVNRLEGMDLQHAEMVLEKLAKMHAASACLFEKSGPFSAQLMRNMVSDELETMFKAMQSMMWNRVCKSIRQWNTCQQYAERMENMSERSGELQKAVFMRYDDEFNVILHGDLWTNNIMFQQDENGVAKDVLFVDLQVSRYASPVQDLVYFILTSTNNSIRVEKFDYLIAYYHNELVKHLEILNYPKPAPTLVDLHTSILKKIFYGVVVATGVMAIALVPPREDATMDSFLEGGDNPFMTDTYTNPRYIKACEIVFPFLENKGAFDL